MIWYANNNKSLCEAGCDFVQYHKDLGQAECSCEAKTNLNLVSDIQVDKSKLYNFIDIKKIANFDVMKCYNLVTSFDGLKGNIGFYCFLPVFLMLLISCIIFYCKEFKTIKRQINEIVYAKMNYQYMSIVKPKPKPKEVKPKYEEPIFLQFLKKKKKNSVKERRGGMSQSFNQTKSTGNKINNIQNKIQININLPEREEEPKKAKNNQNNQNNKNQNLKKIQNQNPKKKEKQIENIDNEINDDESSLGAPPKKNFPIKKPGIKKMITDIEDKPKKMKKKKKKKKKRMILF